MVVLDTNVVSEVLRSTPTTSVVEWLTRQPRESVFLTSVTVAEMLFGLELLPHGRRRQLLAEATEITLERFLGKVLTFDLEAARAFAPIVARRRKLGRPISQSDAMIAAIAQSRGAKLATRDSDFSDCGIDLVNPWGRHA